MTERELRDLLATWLKSTSGMHMTIRDRYEVVIQAAYSMPIGDYYTGEDLGVAMVELAFASLNNIDKRRHESRMRAIFEDHAIKMAAIFKKSL